MKKLLFIIFIILGISLLIRAYFEYKTDKFPPAISTEYTDPNSITVYPQPVLPDCYPDQSITDDYGVKVCTCQGKIDVKGLTPVCRDVK